MCVECLGKRCAFLVCIGNGSDSLNTVVFLSPFSSRLVLRLFPPISMGGVHRVCVCVCACTFPRLWWYAPTCRSPRSSILECVPREVKFFIHFFPCSSEANISAKNRIYRKRLKGKAAVLSEVFFGHGKKREEKNTEQNRRISKPFRNHLLFQ
jgi:hypothetical protein